MTATMQTPVTEGDKQMYTSRQAAAVVGVLFILATVSAMLGLFVFYPPILTGPDYLVNAAAHANQVLLGALMELILVGAAIGTAIGLFPVLRPYGERIALGHLCFRFLEAIVITVGVVAILTLLSLSQEFGASAAPNASAFYASGVLLRAVYKWAFMLGPLLFLGINTLMYSYLLFKSRLVPRPLAGLGLTGATLVLGYGLLVMFGVTVQNSAPWVLLALPIAVYEIILAGWLIVKGFSPSAATLASPNRPNRPLTHELLSAE